MSRKKPRKKKAEEEPANFLGEVEEIATEEQTTEEEEAEAQPQEETAKTKLEKLQPLPISVPCSTCQTDKKAYSIKIDKKGAFLFELECGHVEAYDFKLELHGDKAIEQFGE